MGMGVVRGIDSSSSNQFCLTGAARYTRGGEDTPLAEAVARRKLAAYRYGGMRWVEGSWDLTDLLRHDMVFGFDVMYHQGHAKRFNSWSFMLSSTLTHVFRIRIALGFLSCP